MVNELKRRYLDAIDAIAVLPDTLRKVYSDMLYRLKGMPTIYDEYYEVLFNYYDNSGVIPPMVSCLMQRMPETWDEFQDHYTNHVFLRAVFLQQREMSQRLLACYVELMFTLKDPWQIRAQMRNMMIKLIRTDPYYADMLYRFMLSHEPLPRYTQGGKKKTRKRSLRKKKSKNKSK